jgi:hypothetical protein
MTTGMEGQTTTPEYRGTPEDRGSRGVSRSVERRQDETKPFFATTEFWATVGGIAALVVLYNVTEEPSLDLFRTCLLCTLAGIAYVVSRGLAKSGAIRRADRYRDQA